MHKPILDLHGVDLSEAELTRANLAGAHLSGVNLSGARLTGADLTGANLDGANLRGADLTGANLANAHLQGADLRGAKLDGAVLDGAIEPAGYVIAGDDSVELALNIREGHLYWFKVVGDSMEQADIYEGDRVVVTASSDIPNEGEIIVTMYCSIHIIGESEPDLAGPTIKRYLGRGRPDGPFRLQGWTTKRKIRASIIHPIGRVVAICRDSPLRPGYEVNK
ncbi:MAG: pentapeptide repeat-containing protein [Candidatus Methanosuratincola sp.]